MLPDIPASAGIWDQIWASGHIAVKHLAYANASRHSRREKSSREKQRRPEKAREIKNDSKQNGKEQTGTGAEPDWKKGRRGKTPSLLFFREIYGRLRDQDLEGQRSKNRNCPACLGRLSPSLVIERKSKIEWSDSIASKPMLKPGCYVKIIQKE
jgi:hypothetical protein